MRSSETEDRLGYWNRYEETWLGVEDRSGNRRFIRERVLEESVEELVKRRLDDWLQPF